MSASETTTKQLEEKSTIDDGSYESLEEPLISIVVQTPNGEKLRLEHISTVDTVLSLKQLLAELPTVACLTCYHLELRNNNGEWIELNDYVELGEYQGLEEDSLLKISLDRYDARKSKIHVRRLREVLANPPISLAAPTKTAENKIKKEKHKKEKNQKLNKQKTSDPLTEEKALEYRKQQMEELIKKLPDVTIPVECNLSLFYEDITSKKVKGKKNKRSGFSSLSSCLPKCLETIVFSGYNPPPTYRRLLGDLFYLQITALDGAIYHISCHVTGFFINQSTSNTFNPLCSSLYSPQHSLLDLLLNSVESFKVQYDLLLKQACSLAKRGPMSLEYLITDGNISNANSQWNVPVLSNSLSTEDNNESNLSLHSFDLNRAEDELLSSYGMDERGVLRDWNEEYQCCKELPSSTIKEQLIRSRMIYKVMSEFVEAATQGAIAIAQGNIPPINPMDQEKAHVYVFNNIFFSMAIDGKNALKDINGDDAPYASASHDLQGVLAYNQADIPGLHTLATAVIDYLGFRLVAQSIIPGILQGEAASKLIYGSVDGGKTIASNTSMHELMCQAGKKLLIAEREIQPLGKDLEEDVVEEKEQKETSSSLITQENGAGIQVVKLCGPVEAKGILGSDGRPYVLDLVRITPKDASYYEKLNELKDDKSGLEFNREGYMAVLRPELVHQFSQFNIKKAKYEYLQEQQQKKEKEQEQQKNEKEQEDINLQQNDKEFEYKETLLNPNVFMKYKACVDETTALKDEELARAAAIYLHKTAIPSLLSEFFRGVISLIDGESLTEAMHTNGINIRYLGRLASLVSNLEQNNIAPKYLLELLETEMVARVFKYILNYSLMENAELRSSPGDYVISLLNSLLGKNYKSSYPSSNEFMDINDIKLWNEINQLVKDRFGYNLCLWSTTTTTTTKSSTTTTTKSSSSSINKKDNYILSKLSLLRRICQKTGIRILSKNYDFTCSNPFTIQDIAGISPVVKSSLPKYPYQQAHILIENGRTHLSAGSLSSAYELLQEASLLLYRVCGAAHEEAAICCSAMSMVLFHAGDITGAISQQQKTLALYMQLKGIDHSDTAFAHGNLSLFLHADGQTDKAIKHMQRAIYLLQIAGGINLPELSSLYSRLAVMYQDLNCKEMSLKCYQETLNHGKKDNLQAATTYHQMALSCYQSKEYRDALNYEKKCYSLCKAFFGEKDRRTIDSQNSMEKFTKKAVEGAKGKMELEAAEAAEAIAISLAKEADDIVQDLSKISIKKSSKKSRKKQGGKKE